MTHLRINRVNNGSILVQKSKLEKKEVNCICKKNFTFTLLEKRLRIKICQIWRFYSSNRIRQFVLGNIFFYLVAFKMPLKEFAKKSSFLGGGGMSTIPNFYYVKAEVRSQQLVLTYTRNKNKVLPFLRRRYSGSKSAKRQEKRFALTKIASTIIIPQQNQN